MKALKGQVFLLRRSLYGLKQASRQWNEEFTRHLQIFGFNQSQADQCLFIYCVDKGTLFLIVYVDDLLLISTSEDLIQELK